MYNPINDRINNLMNQKQMIESQLQNIQQLANIPPININNQITPNMALNDFNGKWVNNEQEARNMMVNGLPSIMLDRNDSVFYMKSLDGSFKKYRFQEETEPKKDNIEQRLDKLEAMILGLTNGNNINTKAEKETTMNGVVEIGFGLSFYSSYSVEIGVTMVTYRMTH